MQSVLMTRALCVAVNAGEKSVVYGELNL